MNRLSRVYSKALQPAVAGDIIFTRMTITIELPAKTERVLRKRAKRRGVELGAFVEDLLNREVDLSFEELVRPIQEQTRRLRLTAKDIEELVDAEVAAVRREKPLRCR